MKDKWAFNPFSGILAEDLEKIIIPKFEVAAIQASIQQSSSIAIEFVGKQGRGKTTHLVYLQRQMPTYPIYLLNAHSNPAPLMQDQSAVIFIDSIHHLSVFDRLKLFKSKKAIIYTTHWSRKMECFLVGKKHHAIKFKGITKEILKEVLHKRLQLATSDKVAIQSAFSDKDIALLLKRFGDNYRGIINHLYEQYQ